MRYIRAGLNQRERKLISYRTKKALAYKKENSDWIPGRPPFGYHFENGKHVEDVHEQIIIARILQLRQAGHTIRAIQAKLEAESLFNRKNNPIGRNEICQVLKKAA